MRDPCARWRQLLGCDDLVGRSAALATALEEAHEAAGCDLPVLILGETGTGKNLLARAVHEASARGGHPFVTVACNTVPETLFDAHLFGSKKGAYTGAVQATEGFVERADGGTLFLDEVGELPFQVQTKLLTLVQSGTWSPLGSTRERRADVRVLAATNAPVAALRADIYHRLGAYVIRMPSLAERVEDIPLIADAIVEKYARSKGRPVLSLEVDTVQVLLARSWEGNVRALENVMRRALEKAWREGAIRIEARHLAAGELPVAGPPRLWDQVKAFEAWLVDRAVDGNQGDVLVAANVLGVSKSWIYKHLKTRLQPAGT